MSRRWTTEVSVLAAALIGAASIARLTTGNAAWRAVLVTAVVGAMVTAGASRRLSTSWSVVAGTVAVVLTAVWVSVPGATRGGLPTPTTLRTLDRALKAVGGVHVPMTSRTGVVLTCALVAGVMAVVTRALPGALGLVPTVALVAASTVALPSDGAALLAVLLAVAAGTTLVSRTDQRVGWQVGTVTTLASALCVVLVGTVSGPAVASGGGRAVEGVPPTALSLVSHLTGLQIRDPDLVLFTAVTPVPTYWQVASLSVLRGDTWVPDAATDAALAGRPTSLTPSPTPGGRPFTVTVTVANLASRLLPVPPSTTGVSTAALTPVGAVAAEVSQPGQHYKATATVPEVDTGATAPTATAPTAPASTTTGSTTTTGTPDASDTQLPAEPPVVTALARSVTASASTPLEKAEALTNWFRSRLFHYSLRPTRTTLVSFLTTSHTGSCEQFAGAFAVLARAVGLPTRVAIGFTTGVREPAGPTVVRGIDAHAWPEVLVGGTWISFEPTPELPSGELSPPGVIGTTAVGTPNPISATTIPHSFPRTSIPLPTPPGATKPAGSGSGSGPWIVVGGVAVVVMGAVLHIVGRRRRRRTTDDELVLAWRRVDRALERRAVARPPWRTPVTHARWLRSGNPDHAWDAVLTDLEWLAAEVEDAAYGGASADAHVADHARAASRRIARALSTSGR
jgi:transglutaminase-like putative cysteine protease